MLGWNTAPRSKRTSRFGLLRLPLAFGGPLLLLMIAGSLAGRAAPRTATVQFNRDIRPLLSDNCFYCHGPDKNHRQAGLRLDQRDAALAKNAFVPGKPDQSALIARVFATDEAMLMPPVSAHKTLTATQKNLLRRWIAEGAVYQSHWAYLPIRRPALPKLADTKIANPIDAFIEARLAQEKIAPSPPADRPTLIRRVTLDLTGLPPTTEEVRAFVSDQSPDAYEKIVDRLLASPRYGERMAVPWLDAVRYADTVGFHGDQNQNAWAYRDYVIGAFNRNQPFDRFVIEQVAGDLLPDATPEQRTATAFNRLNMVTREGGAQAKEYLAKYGADRVRTVGMAFLGSTLGCAECHDHKFDPISTRDFYAMSAFFADVQQWGVYADYGYTPNPDLKGYNNDYPFPPEITVASPYLKRRIARQEGRIAQVVNETQAALQRDPATQAAFAAWRGDAVGFLKAHPDGWQSPVRPEVVATAAKKDDPAPAHRVLDDGSVVLTDKAAGTIAVTLRPDAGWLAALRVEALPDARNGGTVFRQDANAATLTLSAAVHRAAGGKAEPVKFRHASANFAEPRYNNGFEIVGVQSGWRLATDHKTEPHDSVWRLETPLRIAPGDTLTITFPNLMAGRVRVGTSPFVPENPNGLALPLPELRAALESPEAPVSKPLALHAYLAGTAWDKDAFAQVRALEQEVLDCRDGKTPVLVTQSVPPPITRVLPRGNWQDESGAIVAPAVLHFLPQPDAAGRPQTRLDLALWLVSGDNPLTARVFVNRLWRQFFGNGLSGIVEDLGAQGEWPTHPELLDWLAAEFRDRGWDVKHMVRLLVTSATYRQSSNLRPELHERDPNNRLLASQNPRRLEAEFVRDNALAIAGLLHNEVGGPPVKPYQPEGYYASIQFPDRRYDADDDERQYRRGVYMHWQRTFLHPMLVNFDAPSREDAVCTRNVANTPQQALTLLNDPTFVEAARVWASRLLRVPGSDDARLEAAYRQALSRPITAKEKTSLRAFLAKMRDAYQERPDDARKLLGIGNMPAPGAADAVELAAWTSVCRVVLNLNETITRY